MAGERAEVRFEDHHFFAEKAGSSYLSNAVFLVRWFATPVQCKRNSDNIVVAITQTQWNVLDTLLLCGSPRISMQLKGNMGSRLNQKD